MSVDKLHIYEEQVDPNYGIKYTSLKNALNNYYSTLNSIDGGITFTIPSLMEEDQDISHSQYGEYPLNYINSIVGFHHFFELYIKEVLSEYDPLLAKKIISSNKIEDIFKQIDSGLVKTAKESVNFDFALKIIKKFSNADSNINSKYLLKPKHQFLAKEKTQKALLKLHEYRNSTLHKGDIILSYLPFDYFITQLILPIVKEVLAIEQLPYNHEINRSVYCGINVLGEIFNIKFSIDKLSDREYSEKFNKKICHLAHLKELGRASFTRSVAQTKQEVEIELKSKPTDFEQSTDGYKRTATLNLQKYKIAEKLSIELHKNTKTNSRIICPCCGAKSLLTYCSIDIPIENFPRAFTDVNEAICNFCTYRINSSMEEPVYFKIMKKPIFIEINEGWMFDSHSPTRKEIDEVENKML